jgi:hypothetical protein
LERAQLKQTAGGAELTDDALNQAATRYVLTGQMPALGMGNAGLRTAILNRAGELFPDSDVGINQAQYKADSSALTQLQKNYDAVTSFERTTQKNLDVLLETLEKLPDTGNRWLNTPLRSLHSGMGGAPVLLFNAARQIDINEIARVVTNPNLTGVLSDTARKEIDQLIPANATVGQIKKIAQLLRRDMGNRKTSITEQLDEINKRMSGRVALPGQSQPTADIDLSKFER